MSEESRLGPDLTHVGSRLYLGAGTVPNDAAGLAQWVAHTQELKPGARVHVYYDGTGETRVVNRVVVDE